LELCDHCFELIVCKSARFTDSDSTHVAEPPKVATSPVPQTNQPNPSTYQDLSQQQYQVPSYIMPMSPNPQANPPPTNPQYALPPTPTAPTTKPGKSSKVIADVNRFYYTDFRSKWPSSRMGDQT
jgi:hypothetical protein